MLVIGGGIAGLRATMAIDPRLSALVITKDKLAQSNSTYAQGGIAGVLGPDDTFRGPRRRHAHRRRRPVRPRSRRDGRPRGAGAHPPADRVGHATSTRSTGELLLGREGGHSHNRIVHALGDATGQEVMRAMIARARDDARRPDLAEHVHDRLADARRPLPRRAGVERRSTARRSSGPSRRFSAPAARGRSFARRPTRVVATGDGHAAAYRAGAELRDMEFMQFHPTVLYIAGSSRSLITEAVRGEGARLVDATGQRFMPDYDPRAELAPRDVVSQAIVAADGKDAAPVRVSRPQPLATREHVRKRFPGIAQTCAEFGIDIATDPHSRCGPAPTT